MSLWPCRRSYRIDVGKEVFYALDDGEKNGILDRITAEKKRGQVQVQRFKGLGEMNPMQLRETTMAPDTRRLVQLTVDAEHAPEEVMDMLLSKKRAKDRRDWLESKGDLDRKWKWCNLTVWNSFPFPLFTEKAYLEYAMYVILDRALPHIGDGLKPVQRRIVYAMCDLGLYCRGQIQEIGEDRGGCAGKISSPRRFGLLRGHGAHGPAVFLPISPDRRAGELGGAR